MGDMKRRVSVRMDVDLLAYLLDEQGREILLKTQNISEDGLSVECSTALRDRLTPHDDFIHEGKPLEIKLLLIIPSELGSKIREEGHPLSVGCHIIYSRRISQSSCRLGLKFIKTTLQDSEHFALFMQKLLVFSF